MKQITMLEVGHARINLFDVFFFVVFDIFLGNFFLLYFISETGRGRCFFFTVFVFFPMDVGFLPFFLYI